MIELPDSSHHLIRTVNRGAYPFSVPCRKGYDPYFSRPHPGLIDSMAKSFTQ